MKEDAPGGIRLLCYLYLANAVFYLISLVLFYSRIFILGQEANGVISWAVRLMLLFIPIYLYYRLGQLKKDAWFLAIYFHIFFVINNSLAFLEYKGYAYSLVHIAGGYASVTYSPKQLLALALNTLVNIFILGYLFKKRGEKWLIQ